jgi:thiol:disulfide interchange protein DsbD
VEVHKRLLELDIPLTEIKAQSVSFSAKYQGCWEGGVCSVSFNDSLSTVLDIDANGTSVDLVTTTSLAFGIVISMVFSNGG